MDELDTFKININLTEYAASQGYRLDRKASSRNSKVMRDARGDKIVVARGADGHWIYFSVRDDSDNGSIIDFVQNRHGCQLGAARQELRPWIGSASRLTRPHPDLFAQEIETISKDRARVLLELTRMKPLAFNGYLEEERCIPRALLQSPRFAGKIKVDFRSNVIFPHCDQDGPCGYEIKNKGFTAFSKGGDKGLWFSAVRIGDTSLVIAESGIDALSYAVLHPNDSTRYASVGGAMNPNQPVLIRSATDRMGQGAVIIAATDNDQDGRKLAAQIRGILADTGRTDLRFLLDLPKKPGDDWNDCLKAARLTNLAKQPDRTQCH